MREPDPEKFYRGWFQAPKPQEKHQAFVTSGLLHLCNLQVLMAEGQAIEAANLLKEAMKLAKNTQMKDQGDLQ